MLSRPVAIGQQRGLRAGLELLDWKLSGVTA